MMNTLIVGGGGFIGTHLTQLLLQEGHSVTVIDRDPSPEFFKINHPKLKLYQENLFQSTNLNKSLIACDAVFHLAAQPSVQICEGNPEESIRDNFNSTQFLLEQLKIAAQDQKKRCIVFTSTSAVYGDVQFTGKISESDPCAPISQYGKDKLRSEGIIFSFTKQHPQVSPAIFRLFNVYGSGQKANSPYSGVITKFFNRLESNQPLLIFGDGNQTRDFIHVKDVVKALYLGSQSSGFEAPMNVATGIGVTINSLAEIFLQIKKGEIVHEPAQSGDIRISIGDPSRIQKSLAWKAEIPLKTGIMDEFKMRLSE